jgi:hypothetical protein
MQRLQQTSQKMARHYQQLHKERGAFTKVNSFVRIEVPLAAVSSCIKLLPQFRRVKNLF